MQLLFLISWSFGFDSDYDFASYAWNVVEYSKFQREILTFVQRS